MSDLNLDEIGAREAAATPGPWDVLGAVREDDGRDALIVCHTLGDRTDAATLAEVPFNAGDDPGDVYADAEFIAHAREDVPALLAEVERQRAKLAGPCGSCHPCTNWADETWRAAGRKPPHVSEWDEQRAELDRLRARLAGGDDSRLDIAERRVSLAQGLAEDWAGSKDVVLASAGYALLNVTGGAR